MAFIAVPCVPGAVGAMVMDNPWPSGECIRINLAVTGTIYMTAAEALKLHAELGAALEEVGYTPVDIEVSDGADDGVSP